MGKILAYLSLLIPQSLLPSWYIHKRLPYFLADPATCEHDWWVVACILSTVELQVQCYRCGKYSEIPDPTLEEWTASHDAMLNSYRWPDPSRVRFHLLVDRKD